MTLTDPGIDRAVVAALASTGEFAEMSESVDEDEHSIEMQLPYVALCTRGLDIPIVPVLVGALNPAAEAKYGRLFEPYLLDPGNVFVISSDFCHWPVLSNGALGSCGAGARGFDTPLLTVRAPPSTSPLRRSTAWWRWIRGCTCSSQRAGDGQH